MNRTISAKGIDLVKQFEGARAQAYRDTGGVYTIGVGHVIKPDEQELLTATLTEQEVNDLLKADIAWAEQAVNNGLKVPVQQNQFDALVSFAFNVGANAFQDSTLLKRINSKAERTAITAEFMRWTKDNGREVTGLKNRRRSEAAHYWQHLTTLVVLLVVGAALLLITASVTILA